VAGMDEVAIRAAAPADARAIAGVYLASFRDTYAFPVAHSDAEVEAWVADVLIPTEEVWVATAADGSIVAMMALTAEASTSCTWRRAGAAGASGAGSSPSPRTVARRGLSSSRSRTTAMPGGSTSSAGSSRSVAATGPATRKGSRTSGTRGGRTPEQDRWPPGQARRDRARQRRSCLT